MDMYIQMIIIKWSISRLGNFFIIKKKLNKEDFLMRIML